MEGVQNLVDYCCIGRRQEIVGQYNPRGDAELQAIAVDCLGRLPPFHVQFTHATRGSRYCFLLHNPFVFFAIVDEALPKPHVFRFLAQLRDEFLSLLPNTKDENPLLINHDLTPTFTRLVAPLVGVPHAHRNKTPPVETPAEAEAEAEASGVLFDKTREQKKTLFPKHEKNKVREIAMVEGPTAGEERDGVASPVSLQRSKGQQIAQRMWWRNVRVVLLLDVIVCAVLFAVWLCICHGFECISD